MILFLLLSGIYDIADFVLGESLSEQYSGFEIPIWFFLLAKILNLAEVLAKIVMLLIFVKVSVNFKKFKQLMNEATKTTQSSSDQVWWIT